MTDTSIKDFEAAIAELESIVKKLEEGFITIAGEAVDSAGKLSFVDRHRQRIYGWSSGEGLTVERDRIPTSLPPSTTGTRS